jgi:hypothetical protein
MGLAGRLEESSLSSLVGLPSADGMPGDWIGGRGMAKGKEGGVPDGIQGGGGGMVASEPNGLGVGGRM